MPEKTAAVQGEADAALVESLRAHVSDTLKGQWQLLQVATALAGVAVSVAFPTLRDDALLLALTSVLFFAFAFAILRQDQEISVISTYLTNTSALGPHAVSQLHWEKHKYDDARRRGLVPKIASVIQASALYGVPVLAALISYAAAIRKLDFRHPDLATIASLVVASTLAILLVVGVVDVVRRYASVGKQEQATP